MLTSQTFMSSRKCGAMDLERDCWKKRYHGAALGGSMRSFCGRLPEADLFIADAVWLRLRTSLNCEIALVSHTEFNVESLLGPSARNLPRNSCRRVSCNDWHDSAEHRSDPEFANFALNSLDAHCNRRVALIFLVVCERTRMAAKYAGSPTARFARAFAVESCLDMGTHCGNTRDYRYHRYGVCDGASGPSAAGGVCCANRLLKIPNAHSRLRDCVY